MLSRDQLKLHGTALARTHHVTIRHSCEQLLSRLKASELILADTCDLLISAVKENFRIAPAGEWLLDNYYLVKEQIHTAMKHLPKGYSQELPRLSSGPSEGLPRVYDIAKETVTHGDGRVDPGNLNGFIEAYQQVSKLKLGELWAIPIMLRIALIENLSRIGQKLAADRLARNMAASWADKMTTTSEKSTKNLILVVADMAHANPSLSSAFVAEIVRCLQNRGTPMALPLTWIEQSLFESGLTIEQLVQSEAQQQAANQLSVSNSIASLRLLGTVDWQEFVETRSHVERILREDPAEVYVKMDFTTRDRYRHVIENIAKNGQIEEDEVASLAIGLAKKVAEKVSSANRSAHVGFYLVGRGLPILEAQAGSIIPSLEAFLRVSRRFPLFLYLGSISAITAIIAWILLAKAISTGINEYLIGLLGITLVLCTSHAAVSMINWLVTLLVPPRALPRMDFSKGIPAQFRALVVVPTLLSSVEGIEHLIEALEVRFLANRDENLSFGLLTGFTDANEKTLPTDELLVSLAVKRIEELNLKYIGKKKGCFFLFLRPRVWNQQENLWMGYERKRGILADLNALLRGDAKNRFSQVVGNIRLLRTVKYVITLDTDTGLPRESARQFVAAMAHPLNHPVYDANKKRIVEGYSILQPQVAVSLPSSSRSLYSAMHESDSGIDPYTRVVSDIYQDVFAEGSFVGKGIYDVDAFELALKGRFPENRILSHDLIEGCYARAGLISDLMLYEEYPARYSADANRRHRWIRGDWQIASWLRQNVPAPKGTTENQPLSWLSQWKILDNLRRSIVPMAFTLMFVLSSIILAPSWFWISVTMAMFIVQPLLAAGVNICRKSKEVLVKQHIMHSLNASGVTLAQMLFTLVCLPYEAFLSFDAIVRTLWRLNVSHKLMLEWNPSVNNDKATSLARSIRTMWFAPGLSLAVIVYATVFMPYVPVFGLILSGIWLVSPIITWWVSRPISRRKSSLTYEQAIFLRKIARRTWAFFATFVAPADNWLPPDNYQENRPIAIAHRTSPTNMGISLLANLAAYDFGYIPTGKLLERTANSLQTMKKMQRHCGHFYNWYDTQSLQPLMPLYVSSVDSGNLAAFIITLRSGLRLLKDRQIVSSRVFEGLSDTLEVIKEACRNGASTSKADFTQINTELALATESSPKSVFSVMQSLKKLIIYGEDLVRTLGVMPESEEGWWAQAFVVQCQEILADLKYLVPWVVSEEDAIKPDASLKEIPTLSYLANLNEESLFLVSEHKDTLLEAGRRARETIATIAALIEQLDDLADMDYSFLYDKISHMLAIGYNVGESRRDASLYDLLASEARLATFVAIAQGQLPQNSWFALGRMLSNVGGDPVLLSWNGSMFEYLMPLLVMPTYAHTLLDQTYSAVVDRQISYGIQCNVPWGVSESGYNMVDAHVNYQYRAFGVPGLGLKRGLAEDIVISPYASVMALMVKPQAACQNMQRLVELGFSGKYGLFEAIDYTPARQTRGQSGVAISSFMAHHQGMSLLALAYKLLDKPMQKRFASEPIFQATTLLLQERVPKNSVYYPHATTLDFRQNPDAIESQMRVFNNPGAQVPQVQLLSNRNYHVMVTCSGGGYSRWQDFAVTRWRPDTTRDNFGTFCYIRDMQTLEFWSNTSQPALKKPETYEVIFSEGRAEFRRRDNDIDLYTEISVSSEDDIELRRIVVTNRSRKPREIELTSYGEVVLAPQATDELHPAFSNLFIQTEILKDFRAILCNRRPRSNSEPAMWMFHLMASHGVNRGEVTYETDRMRFIGRGNTIARPQALTANEALSGSSGSVLDPIVSIRHRLIIEPGKSARLDMVTGLCASRDSALGLVEKYQDRRLADRVFELAWTHSQVTLQQLNTTEADAQHFCRLASSIIYQNSSLRAEPGLIIKNTLRQSNLWGYAISGDLPIVLLRIKDADNIGLVRQLIQAHTYWRLKGLAVDLFIWNENPASYQQSLNDQIMGLIAAGVEAGTMDRSGGIFLRFIEQIPEEDRILLQSVARAIISDSCGGLADQLSSQKAVDKAEQKFKPVKAPFPVSKPLAITPRDDLSFFNGIGGFTPDGKEYVITTAPDLVAPAPWVNILANANFGSVVSENGLAYTWAANAHEFRLTPWNNDPVSDAAGEALYLRDEERGQFWSPMPLPCRGSTPYTTRHGFGYSVFEHTEFGIHSEVWVYVALDAPVKFSVVKVRNVSGQSRKLSLTGYVEWVLGDLQHKTSAQVITIVDPTCEALLARNSYHSEFASRVAFFDANESGRSYSGDRTEFIGRNGSLADPAGMHRARLSNKVGAALDPCAAIQVPFELANEQEREIIFILGTGEDYQATVDIVKRFRGNVAARKELESVWNHWSHTLTAVKVETSDRALNLMANGWLIYQTIACRLWARSGFYQSGGAFGFRDQLQDVMALIHTRPDLVRAHILLCAAHQFKEGDVQHWWHPPLGRGVRTRCSDDYLWLALAVSRYVLTTGDTGVLSEKVDYIDGRQVSKDEDSYYDRPTQAGSPASVYDHCVRAIRLGLRFGEHGLPLIGSGDWNDGMNLVGDLGKGESVWLGFFTYDVLTQFSKVAKANDDLPFSEFCLHSASVLSENIEKNGWDGRWYRRAYFDDGTPLGSASNDECSIDSISQSWSVLSKAGMPERSRLAMESLDARLVDRQHSMVLLLYPPLDKSKLNPGYIKGYVPGVRENGGQYTHGAIWATMAFAASGDHKRAWELMKMINPINHARTLQEVNTYKVEPYVVAADVYGVSPHAGRGGWTWYTGSAAWMYRLIIESLLGLTLEVDRLWFKPCLPEQGFESYTIHYRYRETVYHIVFTQAQNLKEKIIVVADGQVQSDNSIMLVDDRKDHHAQVQTKSLQ